MARQSQYGDEQKSKIIQAAIAARAKGSWADALGAAKGEGYKGGLAYLVIMVRGRGRPKKAKATKRGRPKGSLTGGGRRGPGRPKQERPLSEIDRIVQQEVASRLKRAQAAAVAAFDRALAV
jgi:hypothetical protein